jgi:hypothetical protein
MAERPCTWSVLCRRLSEAITQANQVLPNALPRLAALTQSRSSILSHLFAGHAERAGPVYKYAKILVWTDMADHASETMFRHVFDLYLIEPASQPRITRTPEDVEMQPMNSQKQHSLSQAAVLSTQSIIQKASTTIPYRYLWNEHGNAPWRRAVHARMRWAAASAIILNSATVALLPGSIT